MQIGNSGKNLIEKTGKEITMRDIEKYQKIYLQDAEDFERYQVFYRRKKILELYAE